MTIEWVQSMEQYIIGNATVNIHGSADPDKLKAATEHFLKQVKIKRKKVQREARKEAYCQSV